MDRLLASVNNFVSELMTECFGQFSLHIVPMVYPDFLMRWWRQVPDRCTTLARLDNVMWRNQLCKTVQKLSFWFVWRIDGPIIVPAGRNYTLQKNRKLTRKELRDISSRHWFESKMHPADRGIVYTWLYAWITYLLCVYFLFNKINTWFQTRHNLPWVSCENENVIE